jgi:hypothetical protein
MMLQMICLFVIVVLLLLAAFAFFYISWFEEVLARQLLEEMLTTQQDDMRLHMLLSEADALLAEARSLRASTKARREAEAQATYRAGKNEPGAAQDGETQACPDESQPK